MDAFSPTKADSNSPGPLLTAQFGAKSLKFLIYKIPIISV